MPGIVPNIQFASRGADAILSDVNAHLIHLASLNVLMEEAAQIVYEATRQWMESRGEGTWERLASWTITSKVQQGAAEPARPLYMYGNLFASAISRTGPYSWFMPVPNGVAFGIDWEVRGVQVAHVLATGGRGRMQAPPGLTLPSGAIKYFGEPTEHGRLPARPIWPPITSIVGMEMKEKIGRLFLTGTTTTGGRVRAPAGGYGKYKGGQ